MLRVRRPGSRAPADEDQAGGKPGVPVTPAERIRERRSRRRGGVVHLGQRLERRREHAVLEEVALPGERVVEDAPRARARSSGRRRVGSQTAAERAARRCSCRSRRCRAARRRRRDRRARPARSGTSSTAGRDGTRSGDRCVSTNGVVDLVAHAVVQRQPRRCGARPARRASVDPRRAVQVRIAGRLAALRAGSRAGNRRPRCRCCRPAEGEVAVRPVDERRP